MNAKNLDILIVGAVILLVFSAYIFPPAMYMSLSAIAVVALAIWFLFRIKEMEHRSKTPADTKSAVPATPEQKSAQEIINEKLNGGAIEKAIDQQFDKMVESVVNDLFGNYGDISRQIQKKLKDTMNPYIEQYDFSQHTVKLEHLLNETVRQLTSQQDRIIRNMQAVMGAEPVAEIKASELFERFAEHAGEFVETKGLEIDYDDSPSYQYLTGSMSCEDERSYSSSIERKRLTFACEEDESLGVELVISRWPDFSDDAWRISSIRRPGRVAGRTYRHRDDSDITSLDTPFRNLRNLDEFDAFLLKLYYDNASIILDETDILDEEIEVKAEPECYME